METRSNHVLVGGVVLAIIVVAVGFLLWMANMGGANQQKFDIFFRSSVDGLAKGAVVTFSGVPVGKVDEIKLLPNSPEFVRVRIDVDPDTPVLQGTTATLASVGFTGVSQINLDGAIRGAPPIARPGPAGVPVIPTKPGAFSQLLQSAPELLDKVSTLTERLTELVDDRNRNSIGHILANVDQLTSQLAQQGPQIRQTLAAAQTAIGQAGAAADQIAALAANANGTLSKQVDPAMVELRQTIASAHQAMDNLNQTVSAAKPGVDAFSKQTVPQVGLLVRDLRDMSQALTGVANRLDRGGASGLIGGNRLPDYKGK